MEINLKFIVIVLFVVLIAGALIGAYEMEIGPFKEDDENGGNDGIITPPKDKGPVAVISKNRTNADVGQGINFDGSGSYDDESTIIKYHWNFDDGNSGDNMTVNHSWSSPGAYNVTLVVEDADGNTNVTWAWIGVTYRVHEEGNTNGANEMFDFSMTDNAQKLYINTTIQNGNTNSGDNNVTIRISFDGTVVQENTVELEESAGEVHIVKVQYTNHTNLTAGTWTWELIVNESGVVCDIDWETDVAILYAQWW
jgi:PKD repeat protein